MLLRVAIVAVLSLLSYAAVGAQEFESQLAGFHSLTGAQQQGLLQAIAVEAAVDPSSMLIGNRVSPIGVLPPSAVSAVLADVTAAIGADSLLGTAVYCLSVEPEPSAKINALTIIREVGGSDLAPSVAPIALSGCGSDAVQSAAIKCLMRIAPELAHPILMQVFAEGDQPPCSRVTAFREVWRTATEETRSGLATSATEVLADAGTPLTVFGEVVPLVRDHAEAWMVNAVSQDIESNKRGVLLGALSQSSDTSVSGFALGALFDGALDAEGQLALLASISAEDPSAVLSEYVVGLVLSSNYRVRFSAYSVASRAGWSPPSPEFPEEFHVDMALW